MEGRDFFAEMCSARLIGRGDLPGGPLGTFSGGTGRVEIGKRGVDGFAGKKCY
jgi:hypothetical protein